MQADGGLKFFGSDEVHEVGRADQVAGEVEFDLGAKSAGLGEGAEEVVEPAREGGTAEAEQAKRFAVIGRVGDAGERVGQLGGEQRVAVAGPEFAEPLLDARVLRENDVEPTVIDLNLGVVKSLKEQGISAVYGDVAKRETLLGAGIAQAGSLILSASNIATSAEVIRLAKELNPNIRVLARSAYVGELESLRQAGAHRTYSGEGEVALAFTVAVLRELGATADQIDRERERVQQDLFGKPAPAQPKPAELQSTAANVKPEPEVDSVAAAAETSATDEEPPA